LATSAKISRMDYYRSASASARETEEEAVANAREAIELTIEDMLANQPVDGLPV
jgi:hypothetical protein